MINWSGSWVPYDDPLISQSTKTAYLAGLHTQRNLSQNPETWLCTKCGEKIPGGKIGVSYGEGVVTPLPVCPTDGCTGIGPDLQPDEAAT